MRQKPQDLSGPLTTTPQANLVDTFAPKDLSLAGKAPVQQELLDFSTLSNAAKKLLDQRAEFNTEEGAKVGAKVGTLLQQGKTEEEIYKAITESGGTPRSIAAKFAKAAQAGKIDQVDIPGFKVGLAEARGTFVAAQVKNSAEELIPAFAAKLSQVSPGDDAAEAQIIEEALSTLRENNQEDLSKLDFFGNRAAEPLLQDISIQFLSKLRGEARTLQQKERIDLAGVAVNEFVKGYGAQGSTRDDEIAQLSGIGAVYTQLRLEGNPQAREIVEEKLIVASQNIVRTQGYKEAERFLEDAYLNTKEASGAAVFSENPSGKLLDAIEQAKFRAERENDTKAQKLSTLQRETAIAFENSEGIQKVVEAYRDPSPDAVRIATENALTAIREGDPDVLAQFGLTPETAKFAPAFLRDLEQSALQDAKSYRADVYQSIRSDVLAIALDQSPEEALSRLSGLGLRPAERIQLGEEIRALQNSGAGQAFSQLMQTGVIDQIRYAVAATLPDDSPLAQDRANQEVSRFLDEFVAAGYGDENPLKGPAAYKVGFEFIEAMKSRYAPDDTEAKKAQAALSASQGDTVKAEKFLQRAEGYKNDVTATRAGVSPTILGGVKREGAPDNLLGFERHLATTPAKDLFKTERDFRVGIQRLNEVVGGKGIPSEAKNAAITEATLRMGLVPLMSLNSGDIEAVRTAAVGQFVAYRTKQSRRMAPGSERFVLSLDGWDDVDLNGVNPRLTPFPDFQDAIEYLVSDPTDANINRWNPLKPLEASKRAAIENFLEATGVVADDDAIKDFLYSQSVLWK